jgi:hypothetical protein
MRMIALLSTILASTALSYTPLLAGDKEEPVPQIIGSPKRAPTPTIPKGTPTEQVRALISQYDSAMAAFRRLYDSAKTDEDKAKAEPLYPQTQPYATLLMQIAEDNPKDSAAVDASSCSGLDRGFPMDVGPTRANPEYVAEVVLAGNAIGQGQHAGEELGLEGRRAGVAAARCWEPASRTASHPWQRVPV